MLVTVRHRLRHHPIDPGTRILIVGTFSPDVEGNPADSFYGRVRNHFWTLITAAFGEPSLKGKTKEEKLAFARRHHLDFIDLIEELEVDIGQECNYNDDYIDGRVKSWFDVKAEIEKLTRLEKVCFTRRSFSQIPNLRSKIAEIEQLCREKDIRFAYLTTPSRFYSKAKEEEWRAFFRG